MSLRTHSSRRRLAASVAALSLAVLSGVAVSAPAAHADGSGTLTVVGTSDVFDSNLIQSVIKPGFEAAYPDVTLNYVSKGTGAAITYAEAGTASALLVHAASLENQFVAQGYSLEDFGRAIFYGDYVLLGPANDPAGVMDGASNDIVSAFQKIATAGADGTANFVSRGGTPGTTVQEHAIWNLTTGVQTCNVSAPNGGGTSPSTTTGDCPDNISYPSWYHATGLTQGPNVVNAATCNYTGGGCYVFTDRGTFQYLETQQPNQVSNLQIVTRNNSASATGGDTLLVNSFHAYAINPAKFAGNPNVTLNTNAAKEFLNWITSPAAQDAVGNYLSNSPDGAPFIPDAAPHVTTTQLPTSVLGGRSISVKGTLSNVVPGTPKLNNVPVFLRSSPSPGSAAPTVVAQTTTDSLGRFTLTYRPVANRTYSVSTNQISKVEIGPPTLDPSFGDLLAPVATPKSGVVGVVGQIGLNNGRFVASKGKVTGGVGLRPTVTGRGGVLKLYGGRITSKTPSPAMHFIAELPLSAGQNSRNFSFQLSAGKWKLQLYYVNLGVIVHGNITARTVTVG